MTTARTTGAPTPEDPPRATCPPPAHTTRRALLLAVVSAALGLLATACTLVPNTGPDGDAFYTPPSPLPAGTTGDVVWYHSTSALGAPSSDAWQIMYRSTSATGQANVVTGVVIVPTAAWTGSGPRPIVAFAPGTQGLGDQCAPSKSISTGTGIGGGEVNAALNKGWAVVQTDYEGLGTPGEHTYIVGPAMGHAVLDSVRAATRLPFLNLKATAPVAIWGYSEGGAAAGWAGELQPTYAPDVNLKGVAAGGVPADLVAVANNLDGGLGFGFLAAAAVGFDAAYPELQLATYLNAAGKDAFAKGKQMCATEAIATFAFKRISDYTTANPLKTSPAWQARINASKLGTKKPPAPELLYHGEQDEFIPLAQAQALKSAYCAKGVKVRWQTYGGDHLVVAGSGVNDATAWIADRFAGTAAPSSC